MHKTVVLLSGGIDSATCLWWAKKKNWDIYTISFNYFNRTKRETRATELLLEQVDVKQHKNVEIPFLKDIEDLMKLHFNVSTKITTFPSAYIPSRNLIFYGLAASWAESIGAKWIVGGHHKLDFDLFPDSTPEFFKLLNELLRIGTWISKKNTLKIIRPLETLNKYDVLKLALKLKVPLHLTWSCYHGGVKPCEKCDACIKRKEAFNTMKLSDPLYDY